MFRYFLIICSLLTHVCIAQNTIGIKCGYAQTYVRNNAFFIPATPIYRLQYGISYTRQFKRFNYGLEILSDNRGFTRDNYVNNLTPILEDTNMYPQKAIYSYVSLPIFIGYKSKQRLYYSGKIGYSYSVLLHAITYKPLADKNTGLYSIDSSVNITHDINRNDHSWFLEIGGGYKITPKFELSVLFRNNRSFISHPKDNFYSYFDKSKQSWFFLKHRMFILFLEINYTL
ncbi:MAG: hypothetical protein IPI46_13730 [Bacteroidetes bacterium]|nr:hypothetical protein [Bacteroidota bacterium]